MRVINGLSGNPVANLKVTANRELAPGQLQWAADRTTDANGQAVYDLDGLGSGATFVLSAIPYNGGIVYSDELRQAGSYDFKVGTVELTVRNPLNGAPLVGVSVTALAKNADGSFTGTKQATTDSLGIIRFDLPGLGSGRVYLFEAKSLSDGSNKRSQEISQAGTYVFTVGSPPLTVTVKNGRSGAVRPGLSLMAYELLSSGGKQWVATRTTDAAGRAVFDLDGLGSGRRYVLTATPYNAGPVTSDPVSVPGAVDFRVGTGPVTLIDDDNKVPLVGVKIIAYAQLSDGTLPWAAEGYADATGTVSFDLPGVSQTIAPPQSVMPARVYAFRAGNPFGNNKEYWSPFIAQEGPVVMHLRRGVAQPLDVVPPSVRVLSPLDGATVDAGGFTVLGQASDNVQIDRVVAVVSDPLRGTTPVATAYDAASHQWTATVSAAAVSTGQTATVAVTAYDLSQNHSTATVAFRPIADAAPPHVTLLAPQDGASVPRSGFFVSGTATDDTGVVNLVATVDDPVLGRTVNQTLGIAWEGI